VLDSDKITESKEITLPTAEVLWECSTINELENVKNQPPVMTPATTLCRSGQGRTNANGTGEEEVETVTRVPFATLTYSERVCFVPPPFIVKQIFDGVPNNPLELILAVKAVGRRGTNKLRLVTWTGTLMSLLNTPV
jgi:hypothetical protein